MAHNSVRLTFDEALTHYVGEFGRGQMLIVALASSLAISNGLVFLLWVMVTVDPIKNHHWQCVNSGDAACRAVYEAPSSQAFCQLPGDAWTWTNTDSLVSRFNLICSDSWKVQLANSFMFIGCFLGSGLFGALSDRIGRKKPMFLATAIAAVATFVSVAAPNYWFVAAMRLLVGMGAAGQVHGILLLCIETSGRSFRGIAAVPEVIMFCIGEYILVAVAYFVPNWRSLFIAAGTVCSAGLLLYPVIPESARWLMSQKGKEHKAVELLRSISARNGSRMPEQHLLPGNKKVVRSSSSMQVQQADQQQQQMRSKSMPALRSSDHPNQSNAAAGSSSSSSDDDNDLSCNLVTDPYITAVDQTALYQKHRTHDQISDLSKQPEDLIDGPAPAAAAAVQPVGLFDLLKQPALAGMSAVMMLTWFANFFTFYIIALGTGGLPGSIYVTFSLNVTGQIVATLFAGAIVEKLGRHNVISGSLLVGGLACLLGANIDNKTAQIVLATIGQFGCTASLTITPTYTAELYPTPCRSTAIGMCNKACRIGGLSAPFMIMLGVSSGIGSAIFLPYVVCGSVCVTAGLLVMFMPETLGKDMPETMEDLHQLQTVFTAKPWQQHGCWGTVLFLFRRRATKPQIPGNLPSTISTSSLKQFQQQDVGRGFEAVERDVENQQLAVSKLGLHDGDDAA